MIQSLYGILRILSGILEIPEIQNTKDSGDSEGQYELNKCFMGFWRFWDSGDLKIQEF